MEAARDYMSDDDQIDMWQGPEEHFQEDCFQVKAEDHPSHSEEERDGVCVVSRRSVALMSRGMARNTVDQDPLKLGQ